MALALTTGVLLVALAVAIVLLTPWDPLPGAHPAPSWPTDFTPEQHDRADAHAHAVRLAVLTSLGLGLVVALVLGLTSWGGRLVAAVARPLGGGWGWQVIVGGLAVLLVPWLLTLPLGARVESVRRDHGLSTRSWGLWAADQARAFGLTAGLTLLALVTVVALARRLPEWWWAPAAAGAALLVVVVSFAYPVVVEPVFNRFESMSQGSLRSSLVELARADGLEVDDVLVADASKRTTSLNAYVSGFGPTKRIVVYDTLLDAASDEEVRLVVAHELGHAKRHDVRNGTLLGALGAAAAVALLALLLRWSGLLARAGVSGPGDGRVVALLVALIALLAFAAGPVQQLVSRRIEARADVHALELTRDPAVFVATQRRLALRNLSDLDPPRLLEVLFASHDNAARRIALAREWARLHGVPVPAGAAR